MVQILQVVKTETGIFKFFKKRLSFQVCIYMHVCMYVFFFLKKIYILFMYIPKKITAFWIPGYGCAMKLPPPTSNSQQLPTSQPAFLPTTAPNSAFDIAYHYSGGMLVNPPYIHTLLYIQ